MFLTKQNKQIKKDVIKKKRSWKYLDHAITVSRCDPHAVGGKLLHDYATSVTFVLVHRKRLFDVPQFDRSIGWSGWKVRAGFVEIDMFDRLFVSFQLKERYRRV